MQDRVTAQRLLLVGSGSRLPRGLLDCLRTAGYDVSVAPVQRALALLREESFDLVMGPTADLVDHLRLESLQPLLEITETLVSETSLGSMAGALLKRVRQEGGATVAWLTLAGDASLLEVSGGTKLPLQALSDLAEWLSGLAGSDPAPQVFSRRRLIAGAEPGSISAEWLAQEVWDRVLMLPLMVKGQRTGTVVAAGDTATLRTQPADLRYLGVLAAQTAIAIENARLYRRARSLSLTDPQTGLPNARFLHDHLPMLVAQARRSGRPLSILFIDSDSLKTVNDRFGHEAGNRFVVELADTIRHGARAHSGGAGERIDGVRESDVVVRYTGGDEFIVMMPDTDTDQALIAGERVRTAVRVRPFHVAGQEVTRTVSIGVATFPDDAAGADELLSAADQAMYEAKRLGKDRVVTFRAMGAPPVSATAV